MLTKWAKQLSAEVDLPASLSGCLRDTVVFEILKTYWGQSFNRYAWVILFDVDSAAMDYYAPDTIRLGHAISYVAKQTLFKIHLESNDARDMARLETDMVKNIILTVKSLATTVEGWETLLGKAESDFMDGRNKKKLSQYFTNLVKSASVVKESDDIYHDETISEQEDEPDTQSKETGSKQGDQSDGEHEDETGSEQQDQLDNGKEDENRSMQKSH